MSEYSGYRIQAAGIIGLALLAVLGCRIDGPSAADKIALQARGGAPFSPWGEPHSLGAPVNTPTFNEQNAVISRDGLTLYFSSDRTGGQGLLDIWVSKRLSTMDPWGTPENLESVNTDHADFAPNLSIDGHLLFFSSNRGKPLPNPDIDIYVLRRSNPHDDGGWGPPTKLGPGVNTPVAEQAPFFLQSAEEGTVNFYFNRGQLMGQNADIYCAAITRQGETLGDAQPVSELNAAGANDAAVSIRRDGLEIFFWSTRRLGGLDLFTSTRQSVVDSWSDPARLEAPLSTAANDVAPSLSFDGRTLIFGSSRDSANNTNDLYFATRTIGWE